MLCLLNFTADDHVGVYMNANRTQCLEGASFGVQRLPGEVLERGPHGLPGGVCAPPPAAPAPVPDDAGPGSSPRRLEQGALGSSFGVSPSSCPFLTLRPWGPDEASASGPGGRWELERRKQRCAVGLASPCINGFPRAGWAFIASLAQRRGTTNQTCHRFFGGGIRTCSPGACRCGLGGKSGGGFTRPCMPLNAFNLSHLSAGCGDHVGAKERPPPVDRPQLMQIRQHSNAVFVPLRQGCAAMLECLPVTIICQSKIVPH